MGGQREMLLDGIGAIKVNVDHGLDWLNIEKN